VIEFEPKDYYEAARERYFQSRFLLSRPQDEAERNLDDKRYALVVYIAGVAVEAVFRAYRLLVTDAFEGRHNLETLFVASNLDQQLRAKLESKKLKPDLVEERLTELAAAVYLVALIWRNDQRYASDRVLVKDLVKRKIITRKENKGDKAALLRAQATKVVDAAEVVIRAGEEAWK
jgi:hypothetical protein